MAAWFSKVFEQSPEEVASAEGTRTSYEEEVELPKPRKVVSPPLLAQGEELSAFSDEIRIKARVDEMNLTCTFLVDRPVLKGLSFYCHDHEYARQHSPLADALYNQGSVGEVTLHDMTVKVSWNGSGRPDWEAWCKAIGGEIRAHLKSGMPVLNPQILDAMPSAEEIQEQIENIIHHKVNPMIAGHGGYITLHRVVGNTAYISMGGGCQGCAASSITLRSGVEKMFREEVPFIGAILDETDHSAGVNPYFKELPVGMGG
jgi:Fe-S cluster biogenesis protein NfuA